MGKTIQNIQTALTKAQPILIWLICAYFAEKFIRNGIIKFDMEGFWSGAFERWGYPIWFMMLIGALEALGGAVLLIPKIRPYGAFVLAIVMLGALVTRLINGVGMDDAISISFFMVTMLYLSSNIKMGLK